MANKVKRPKVSKEGSISINLNKKELDDLVNVLGPKTMGNKAGLNCGVVVCGG